MRLTKCPACGKRHDWKYGVPVSLYGIILLVVECDQAKPDRVIFSMGQPSVERTTTEDSENV